MNSNTYNTILNELIKNNPSYTTEEITIAFDKAINELTKNQMIGRFDGILLNE